MSDQSAVGPVDCRNIGMSLDVVVNFVGHSVKTVNANETQIYAYSCIIYSGAAKYGIQTEEILYPC